MKTAMLTIAGDLSNTGWTPAAAALAAAESVIDSHRFATETDRVLARHEGDEGLALFPSTDELMAMGVSLFDLSRALEAGLKGEDVAGLLASYDADTLNATSPTTTSTPSSRPSTPTRWSGCCIGTASAPASDAEAQAPAGTGASCRCLPFFPIWLWPQGVDRMIARPGSIPGQPPFFNPESTIGSWRRPGPGFTEISGSGAGLT
ncbi:MAG: hypothetical protein IPM23_03310 [Candidatus Melainabacteria bacterium]|nr:hypothetical protein [Candidatus Melainabacteria bacterium]